MKSLTAGAALVALFVSVSQANAQAAAAAAAPAQAGGLVGFCQYLDQKLQACKDKICKCPLGQLISNSEKVMNLYGGGLLCPPCCPPVSEDDLKKASNTAGGACARFRKDLLEMPERRAAVRCLAYADCHWWPEAEAALIAALRTDRHECVRLEAALVLGSGCCCTAKTIEALTISASGSNRDGNPSENSPRVKAAALAALEHCVKCYSEALPEPVAPEKGPPPKPLAALEPLPTPVATVGSDPLLKARVAGAQQVLHDASTKGAPAQQFLTGQRSILELYAGSATPPPNGPATAEPPHEDAGGGRSVWELFRKTSRRDGAPAQ